MKILVSNLHEEVCEEQLQQLFNKYGKVLAAKVVRNADTNQSRGVGVVEMGTRADGETAIKNLNRTNYRSQYLIVSEIKTPHTQLSAQGSGA
jgi:RNA recognition motif-containing protein